MPAAVLERAPRPPSSQPRFKEKPQKMGLAERATSLPLGFVPLERKGITEHQKHVAGHELNHALTAYGLGVSVMTLSIIPEGDSLGRTIFGGGISPIDLQIIATAGSIATHDGSAKGFGSDLHTAHLIEHYYNGMGVDQARNAAIQHVMSVPRDVRERAAEIIAYLGEISGSMIPSILHRAQWEIKLEEEGVLGADQWLQDNKDAGNTDKKDEQEFDTFTILDRFTDINGVEKTRWHIITRTNDEGDTPCPVCKNEKGHNPQCVLATKKDRINDAPVELVSTQKDLEKDEKQEEVVEDPFVAIKSTSITS